jgi:cytoplasmic iron level regulating protein YaaA (DUF328/UPF0246 family)
MLIVISPAKTLDFESPATHAKATKPQFLDAAAELNQALKKYQPEDLQLLQSISNDLAVLNYRRNQSWAPPFNRTNARQAIFAFRGDVYAGLEVERFSQTDLEYAQQHLRILSGLYGLLRPLDLIQPYRLEMGTALDNPRGRNLYAFWGDGITHTLNKALKTGREKVLVNLASQEYFSVIKPNILDAQVITPVFRDWKNGQYKVISFFAKKARGMMAAWILQNRVTDVAMLSQFAGGGYRYSPEDSSAGELVFLCRQGQQDTTRVPATAFPY